MVFVVVPMPTAIFLVFLAGAGAVQVERAQQDASEQRVLMRKEQQRSATSNHTGNHSNSTLENPAGAEHISLQELAEFDPVWAYSAEAAIELMHKTFRPTVSDAEPPRNYVYCNKGGASGPKFEDSYSFDGAPLPKPPMTIAATLSTQQLGRFQIFLGWGEGENTWDAAEFRLSASGNLQYGINDGLSWHNVEANPAINLIDGNEHHVAMVRDENGYADLFINGTRVGYGLIAGNPRVPMNTARAARTMYGLRDLAFTGNVSQVFIYDRALRWWEVNKIPFVPCRDTEHVITHLDFNNAKTFVNLGGLGPDPASDHTGPYGMRFENIANYGGVNLDLYVTNTTYYEPRRADANGLVAANTAVGHVNFRCGSSVGLRFEIVAHGTYHPVVVDNFYFVFMDVDSGPYGTGRESVVFTTDVANFYISSDTTLHHVIPNATTNLVVWAGDAATGDYMNNPTDPLDLDTEQERRSIALVFAGTSGFEVTFNSTVGVGGRDISFTGWSTLIMDAFNTSLNQGVPQTAKEEYFLDPEDHHATGDEMQEGTWE